MILGYVGTEAGIFSKRSNALTRPSSSPSPSFLVNEERKRSERIDDEVEDPLPYPCSTNPPGLIQEYGISRWEKSDGGSDDPQPGSNLEKQSRGPGKETRQKAVNFGEKDSGTPNARWASVLSFGHLGSRREELRGDAARAEQRPHARESVVARQGVASTNHASVPSTGMVCGAIPRGSGNAPLVFL